jgi:hypothetical protein
VLGQPLGGYLPRGREHRERDGKVVARAFLAQARRRQVDSDAAQRPLELRARDSAPHAFLRLLARFVGKPDDRERGHTALKVRLDLDRAGLEAHEGVRDRAREHSPTLRLEAAQVSRGTCR